MVTALGFATYTANMSPSDAPRLSDDLIQNLNRGLVRFTLYDVLSVCAFDSLYHFPLSRCSPRTSICSSLYRPTMWRAMWIGTCFTGRWACFDLFPFFILFAWTVTTQLWPVFLFSSMLISPVCFLFSSPGCRSPRRISSSCVVWVRPGSFTASTGELIWWAELHSYSSQSFPTLSCARVRCVCVYLYDYDEIVVFC